VRKGFGREPESRKLQTIRYVKNGATFDLIFVPGAFLLRGEDQDPSSRDPHPVFLRPFLFGKKLISRKQWATRWMLSNEQRVDENLPHSDITWDQANEFASHFGLRLPTEAEWEYCARGPWGRDWPDGDPVRAIALESVDTETTESWVGAHGMSGTVWQMVSDQYAPYPFDVKTPLRDPHVPATNETSHVVRGASWRSSSQDNDEVFRPTHRGWNTPEYKNPSDGFRVAASLDWPFLQKLYNLPVHDLEDQAREKLAGILTLLAEKTAPESAAKPAHRLRRTWAEWLALVGVEMAVETAPFQFTMFDRRGRATFHRHGPSSPLVKELGLAFLGASQQCPSGLVRWVSRRLSHQAEYVDNGSSPLAVRFTAGAYEVLPHTHCIVVCEYHSERKFDSEQQLGEALALFEAAGWLFFSDEAHGFPPPPES
jgi:hypothetical protein